MKQPMTPEESQAWLEKQKTPKRPANMKAGGSTSKPKARKKHKCKGTGCAIRGTHFTNR